MSASLSTTPNALVSGPVASTSSAPAPPLPGPAPVVLASSAKQPPPFEFMKRKRWADLLISELSDAILLVLSEDCRILFCGRAVQELLGWKDEELVDGDLVELMNGACSFITEALSGVAWHARAPQSNRPWTSSTLASKSRSPLTRARIPPANDRDSFRRMFARALAERRELLTYARLRCKAEYLGTAAGYAQPLQQKEVLFEIGGYAHFSAPEDVHCRCFFAVAKPYPSRNTAMCVPHFLLRALQHGSCGRGGVGAGMLIVVTVAGRMNTFLELKMENARLQERLRVLKEFSAAQTQAAQAGGSAGYGAVPSQIPVNMGFDGVSAYSSGSGGDPSSMAPASYYALQNHGYGAGAYAAVVTAEDDGEDQQAKKKRKVYATEQYVCNTCGRTNSPEWRKGPRGPKTLCNACGLRWAKKVRKFEEATEAGGDSTAQLDSIVPP
ncbi:hypothetical protein EVG20_g10821 [Dentipellis fragilis]|uniref:GATA-type domain-containing protein n=1 Tax=Dentipellis fragilis TaxID=205917 RepID=A0A4Y9XNC8_9AGAM|nr:hypothetical protein EVG20_g10821 [Dentipellis fragilis]